MAVATPRNSRRNLFKRLEIVPIPCEYVFSLTNFTVNIQEHFQTNPAVCNVSTMNNFDYFMVPLNHFY
jgi:hypothetical protein